MVTGLCLLTELLPLPLPVLGRRLSSAEKERCIVVRNLWAANLGPLSDCLHRLLHHLAAAATPSLTHALRRACVALADLAPQLVVVILRPLLDLALQYQKTDNTAPVATVAGNTAPVAAMAGNVNRLIYMLASLASHPGCKSAMLHLFTTEQYSQLLPGWYCVIQEKPVVADVLSTPTDASILKPHHAPLCLLLHNLCNAHINLQVRSSYFY